MRFSSVIVSFIFYVFLSCAAEKGLYGLSLLAKQRDRFRREALCTRFVSESFRKTCQGKGFESLSEWKKSCRAMWQLDFIDYEQMGEKVCRGVWISASVRYEVYFRERI